MAGKIKHKMDEFLLKDSGSVRVFLMFTLVVAGMLFAAFNLQTDAAQQLDPEESCAPDSQRISISVVYSSEVDYYLPTIMKHFNELSAAGGLNPATNAPLAVGGRSICVTGKPVSAGTARTGLVNAIIAPNNANVLQPTIWSPSTRTWLLLANNDAGEQLFDMAETKATANAPVVIAIWQSRLDAIRRKVGYDEIGWEELLAVLTSPNGWCDYGLNPCRPGVYYGHTNPFNSPTGLSTLISEFYASARANGFTEPTLNLAAVNRPDIELGVSDIEKLIRHYSDRTTEFINYIAQGPEYVDFVALEENDVISINQGFRPNGQPLGKPPEPLVALYPKEGTFVHDHPFGIVNADWVAQEQHDAAVVFHDYVLTKPEQTFIMSKNFRPANPDVATGDPINMANGVDPNSPKTFLTIPDTETLVAIQDNWGFIKKRADILLLIDVSGSMADEGKLDQAKQALSVFLDKVNLQNRVGIMTFSSDIKVNFPMSNLEAHKDQLRTAVESLTSEGGTELYAAVQRGVRWIDQGSGDDRIRVIVLLSDGQDTGGATLDDAVKTIKDTAQNLNPVIVIPVAYGSDADFNALNTLARVSRTGLQFGDPENIQNVLTIIAGLG